MKTNIFQVVVLWCGVIVLAFFAVKKPETLTIGASAVLAVFALVMTVINLRGKNTDKSGQPPQPETNPDPAAGNYPSVEVPVLGKPRMVFKRDCVEYKGKVVYYNQLTGVFYNTVKLSVNLIPVSQSYTFCITSENTKIKVNYASFFYIGNKKLLEGYTKLLEMAKIYIEPFVVLKYVKDIFEAGKTVKIGSVEFTKAGYSKKKLFGGREEVLWTDKVYIPQYYQGMVYMYKVKNDKPKTFAGLSMQSMNSVVVPLLVQECYNRTHPQVKK